MAKPKHPTMKSLRQGQTIYYISDDSYCYGGTAGSMLTVMKYFLHSHNTPEPLQGCVIEKLPVTHLKKHIKRGNVALAQFYYSRRRCEAAMAGMIKT